MKDPRRQKVTDPLEWLEAAQRRYDDHWHPEDGGTS